MGELVTIVGIVSMAGLPIPPVLIFLRVNFNENRTTGGVCQRVSILLVSGNGWMKSEKLKKVMEHFVKHTRPTSDKPVIFILDNHRSHLNVEALEFAKVTNVHVFITSPHK